MENLKFKFILEDPATKKNYEEMIFAVKDSDDEVAHIREDRLRHRVLELIADGHPHSKELAQEVLQTSKLDFLRWCV